MEEEQTKKGYKYFEAVYDDGLDFECEPDYDIPCFGFCDI